MELTASGGLKRWGGLEASLKTRKCVWLSTNGQMAKLWQPGYGNDLFCTDDRGASLGDRSILHPDHRDWLSEMYGVTIVNLAELAERLATAP